MQKMEKPLFCYPKNRKKVKNRRKNSRKTGKKFEKHSNHLLSHPLATESSTHPSINPSIDPSINPFINPCINQSNIPSQLPPSHPSTNPSTHPPTPSPTRPTQPSRIPPVRSPNHSSVPPSNPFSVSPSNPSSLSSYNPTPKNLKNLFQYNIRNKNIFRQKKNYLFGDSDDDLFEANDANNIINIINTINNKSKRTRYNNSPVELRGNIKRSLENDLMNSGGSNEEVFGELPEKIELVELDDGSMVKEKDFGKHRGNDDSNDKDNDKTDANDVDLNNYIARIASVRNDMSNGNPQTKSRSPIFDNPVTNCDDKLSLNVEDGLFLTMENLSIKNNDVISVSNFCNNARSSSETRKLETLKKDNIKNDIQKKLSELENFMLVSSSSAEKVEEKKETKVKYLETSPSESSIHLKESVAKDLPKKSRSNKVLFSDHISVACGSSQNVEKNEDEGEDEKPENFLQKTNYLNVLSQETTLKNLIAKGFEAEKADGDRKKKKTFRDFRDLFDLDNLASEQTHEPANKDLWDNKKLQLLTTYISSLPGKTLSPSLSNFDSNFNETAKGKNSVYVRPQVPGKRKGILGAEHWQNEVLISDSPLSHFDFPVSGEKLPSVKKDSETGSVAKIKQQKILTPRSDEASENEKIIEEILEKNKKKKIKKKNKKNKKIKNIKKCFYCSLRRGHKYVCCRCDDDDVEDDEEEDDDCRSNICNRDACQNAQPPVCPHIFPQVFFGKHANKNKQTYTQHLEELLKKRDEGRLEEWKSNEEQLEDRDSFKMKIPKNVKIFPKKNSCGFLEQFSGTITNFETLANTASAANTTGENHTKNKKNKKHKNKKSADQKGDESKYGDSTLALMDQNHSYKNKILERRTHARNNCIQNQDNKTKTIDFGSQTRGFKVEDSNCVKQDGDIKTQAGDFISDLQKLLKVHFGKLMGNQRGEEKDYEKKIEKHGSEMTGDYGKEIRETGSEIVDDDGEEVGEDEVGEELWLTKRSCENTGFKGASDYDGGGEVRKDGDEVKVGEREEPQEDLSTDSVEAIKNIFLESDDWKKLFINRKVKEEKKKEIKNKKNEPENKKIKKHINEPFQTTKTGQNKNRPSNKESSLIRRQITGNIERVKMPPHIYVIEQSYTVPKMLSFSGTKENPKFPPAEWLPENKLDETKNDSMSKGDNPLTSDALTKRPDINFIPFFMEKSNESACKNLKNFGKFLDGNDSKLKKSLNNYFSKNLLQTNQTLKIIPGRTPALGLSSISDRTDVQKRKINKDNKKIISNKLISKSKPNLNQLSSVQITEPKIAPLPRDEYIMSTDESNPNMENFPPNLLKADILDRLNSSVVPHYSSYSGCSFTDEQMVKIPAAVSLLKYFTKKYKKSIQKTKKILVNKNGSKVEKRGLSSQNGGRSKNRKGEKLIYKNSIINENYFKQKEFSKSFMLSEDNNGGDRVEGENTGIKHKFFPRNISRKTNQRSYGGGSDDNDVMNLEERFAKKLPFFNIDNEIESFLESFQGKHQHFTKPMMVKNGNKPVRCRRKEINQKKENSVKNIKRTWSSVFKSISRGRSLKKKEYKKFSPKNGGFEENITDFSVDFIAEDRKYKNEKTGSNDFKLKNGGKKSLKNFENKYNQKASGDKRKISKTKEIDKIIKDTNNEVGGSQKSFRMKKFGGKHNGPKSEEQKKSNNERAVKSERLFFSRMRSISGKTKTSDSFKNLKEEIEIKRGRKRVCTNFLKRRLLSEKIDKKLKINIKNMKKKKIKKPKKLLKSANFLCPKTFDKKINKSESADNAGETEEKALNKITFKKKKTRKNMENSSTEFLSDAAIKPGEFCDKSPINSTKGYKYSSTDHLNKMYDHFVFKTRNNV